MNEVYVYYVTKPNTFDFLRAMLRASRFSIHSKSTE